MSWYKHPLLTGLMRWFLFTVFFALAPLWILALGLRLKGVHPSVGELVRQGELLLICCAVAATGIGDLAGTAGRFSALKIVCTGLCLFVVAIAVGGYTQISFMISHHETYDVPFVATWSIVLFACTTLSGACCVALSRH
jgi:hypothetical protein